MAKQELKLKQEIAVHLQMDAGSVTDQLVKTLTPEILKLMQQMEMAMNNELGRLKHDRQSQMRSVFPEHGG